MAPSSDRFKRSHFVDTIKSIITIETPSVLLFLLSLLKQPSLLLVLAARASSHRHDLRHRMHALFCVQLQLSEAQAQVSTLLAFLILGRLAHHADLSPLLPLDVPDRHKCYYVG